MNAQRPVICLGAAVVDHVLLVDEIPCLPLKVASRRRMTRCGGPAATAAVTCRALGAAAELWSHIGQDREGDFMRGQLLGHGVNLDGLILTDDGATALAFVLVDRRGERMIVYDAATVPISTDHLPLERVAGAGAVLADCSWPAGAAALMEAAEAAGIPSVLDAEGGDDDLLAGLASRASLPVFSKAAFEQLSRGAPADAASCAGIAARLGTDLGVTLGATGSSWWLDGAFVHAPALQVEASDTTGAGDVFHAALAVALAEHRATSDAIRFATAAAGLKCARGEGWNGMPDRAAVERAIRLLP